MTLKELREARGLAISAARAINDKALAEGRDFNADEKSAYDKAMADEARFAAQIERAERLAEAERQAAATAGQEAEQRGAKPGAAEEAAKEVRDAIAAYFRNQISAPELRALSAGLVAEGGYIVMGEQFVSTLLKNVDNDVFIRQKATKYQVPQAQSLGLPYLSADPDDADWTTELATGSEDSAMAFGKRQLFPHPFAKRIKVSNDLLRLALIGPEALVRERLAYKFAVTEEKGFMTGSGANQPLGLFTASNDGVPTSRDVSTDNTTTAFTMDGLINAKYSLKGQYQRVAEWVFHRDAVKLLAKLKDGEGQYIWQPSKQAGDPDRLLGNPVNISEYAPNTFTTGLYVGLIGEMSKYVIADSMGVSVKRLDELYAETNQTGFIGRAAADGMPALAEAFARVKLA